MPDDFTPCEGCQQPESCGGRWPDDDKHRPGQIRGCFGSKAKSVDVTTVAGKTTHYGTDVKPNPQWEKGKAGEVRKDGSFMPYIPAGSGSPMPIKRYGEQRHEVERIRDRQRNDPTVFS